ncbi:Uncharacterised protein [Mesomycoplasma dispar]|uniref:Uncharacterized protein n=1 Tax=Mesomycoplasma dispar TaxID=86660 RepID=A0AAJ5NRL1_9BACT|nr:P110/LppT family adhesin N-terminal domain [Mesomycoplasma dispar]AJR11964.1 hypothetical protein MDIS_00455 [Mesomycoplasma dispar]VEU61247.1 Uncharacterised protein [Mesomycoplasma dispar]
METNNEKIKNPKSIVSLGFSITAIVTTIIAVPIGLTIFERSYGSQVYGNVDKNQVVNLKTEATFSEEDFINAVNNLKIFDKYKNLSAKTALALAKNPSYSFNFLQAFDFSPITKHRFRVVLNIENASVSGSEVKNVVVFAHSDQLKLTYSKKTDLKGFAASDASDGNLVNFQIDLAKSSLSVSGSKSANLTASEVAFKVDNDFQTAYKKTRSLSQAFSDASLENGLSYNLVNNLGLPTILEKGYVLAPKTSVNEKAKQEKLVKIGEEDNKRVEKLLKVQNLVFKNLDDKNGTLSITFELFDPSGKLIKEFDFPITGIKKLEYDVEKAEKDILAKVKEFVQVKPFVQIALVRDNLSLAETVYKTDNNPTNLAKVLAKSAKTETPKSEKTPVSVKNFQDNGQTGGSDNNSGTSTGQTEEQKEKEKPKTDSETKTPGKSAETEKVEINREDFSSFFELKSKLIEIPEFKGYFVEISSVDFAKNLSQEEKDKLLKDHQVSLDVNFSIKKQLDIQAPYLESEFVKSNYSPVLKTSVTKIGKGNNSKLVLLDLGSFKTNIKVQVDYNKYERKLLEVALKQNPNVDLPNLDKINLKDPEFKEFNPLITTVEFKKNPNGEKLTLGRVKSLIEEIVNDAKKNKTFEDVARKLFFLDSGKHPRDLEELDKYKKLHADKFKSQTEKETKPTEETAKPPVSSENGSQNPGTQSTQSPAPQQPAATTAQTTSSSAVVTKFADTKETTKKDSIDKKSDSSSEGLGLKLWSFLQKSNYSSDFGNVDITYNVSQKSNEQIDVELNINQKDSTPVGKAVFSVKKLVDDQGFDFLMKHNPVVFFDFRTKNLTAKKISSLNSEKIKIDVNPKNESESPEGSWPGNSFDFTANPNILTPEGVVINKAIKFGEGKQKSLKKGLILLAFTIPRLNNNQKHYLLSSKQGKGLFIVKTNLDSQQKIMIGLDQYGQSTENGVVGLISGFQGTASGLYNIDLQKGKVENDKNSPIDFETFSQKNISLTSQPKNFDLIKEGDLLFLSIFRDGDKYEFSLSSEKSNYELQKITSKLNLEAYKGSYAYDLDWSFLGPTPTPRIIEESTPFSSHDMSHNVQSLSMPNSFPSYVPSGPPPLIVASGFAVYDSEEIIKDRETVNKLTDNFIRHFKNKK